MFVTLVHCHIKPEHLDAFLDATARTTRGPAVSPATCGST